VSVYGAAQSAPVVTSHPASVTVKAGKSVSFTASATGAPAPSVQWERSVDGGSTWAAIPGYTSTTLSFTTVMGNNNQMFRAHFSNGTSPDALSTAATIKVRSGAQTDLDGDGRADFLVWNVDTGTWHWSNSSGAATTNGLSGIQWGNKSLGDVSLSGDVDGDGIADLVIWRASTGTWYWLTSSSGYSYAAAGVRQWGNQALGDTPLLADFDGDGSADLGIWRASTGTWYWLTSSSGFSYASAGGIQWGNASLGDRPFAGDFDGDGVSDLAVWRASTGTWYWLTSTTGYSYARAGVAQWGNASLGDVPMLGDLDGDGKSDLVIWRSSTGTWYWKTSKTGYVYGLTQSWGNLAYSDIPLLADFDGDGIADIVIYRTLNGGWYWLSSASGFTSSFLTMVGSTSDVPIVR
jgi:hypothetical protein